MRSLLAAILCFGVLFASEALAQGGGANTQAAKKTKPSKSKQAKKKKAVEKQKPPYGMPINVIAVKLSRTEVPAVCPSDNSCTQIIEVTTTALDPENGGVTYVYTISGGKITGSGRNVLWDLSGVKPGTYIITVGIDDGSGWGILGQTQTKEVKVVE